MIEHKCWPTKIFEIPDAIDESDVGSMLNAVYKIWSKTGGTSNWQSSFDLHLLPEFKVLRDFVLITNKKLLEQMNYDVEDIALTGMWANVLRKGEAHPPHTHSNNFLSGVFYLYSDETTGILFHDPRVQTEQIVPRKKKNTPENSSVLSFKSTTNTAIIFPSWLTHFVPVHQSEQNRMSVSWNIQLKGQVGEHHDYQSANF